MFKGISFLCLIVASFLAPRCVVSQTVGLIIGGTANDYTIWPPYTVESYLWDQNCQANQTAANPFPISVGPYPCLVYMVGPPATLFVFGTLRNGRYTFASATAAAGPWATATPVAVPGTLNQELANQNHQGRSCVAVDTRIYFAPLTAGNLAEVFDTVGLTFTTWKSPTPPPTLATPATPVTKYQISQSSLVNVGGTIFAFGTGQKNLGIQSYVPGTDTWAYLTATLPSPITDPFSCALIPTTTQVLCVVKPSTSGTTTYDAVIFETAANAFTITYVNCGYNLTGCYLAPIAGKLYCLGGGTTTPLQSAVQFVPGATGCGYWVNQTLATSPATYPRNFAGLVDVPFAFITAPSAACTGDV